MIKAVLTIDDGPSKITPKIMDFLSSKGIRPIMFMIGVQLEENMGNGVYAIEHGAIAGNHSYSHANFNELTYDECIEEIEKQEVLLRDLYAAAGIERKHKLFRFPFGASGGRNEQRLQDYLRGQGYCRIDDSKIESYWYHGNGFDRRIDATLTFDFGEWQLQCDGFTMDKVFERINEKAPADGTALLVNDSHHILLMHDHEISDELVPGYYEQILDYVLKCGVTFIEPRFGKA